MQRFTGVVMAVADDRSLQSDCLEMARRAKQASIQLARTTGEIKNAWLRRSATELRNETKALLDANQRDLEAAAGFGLTDAAVDRLRLSPERIAAISQGLEEVAALAEPIGPVIDSTVRPNGLRIDKVRVPLGVVFFIYESRPNVTADAAALCVKSGNAVILRGGKEAAHSSRAIVRVLEQVARETGLPEDAVQLVGTTDRQAVGDFLALADLISVAIPRGGEGLIRRVAQEATMPVIKHFAGNCHVYVDRAANMEMAREIVINAKCQRMGVCNAAESLLVHADVAETFLPAIAASLREHEIEMRGDPQVRNLVDDAKPATDDDFATEYLGPTISIRVVASLDEAVEHIERFGSGHTDAIVTDNLAAARDFADRVDSSAVMINASTRFNDGGEFGLGAEIGISTDKFHARGPCGLLELTSYKYVVQGNGQIRDS
ncbi:MAG: glutamate-5-semialdehyde dehydrogenase [Pirellulales bacterium]